MPARKSQFQTWYEIVKKELLVTEPQNILARSECCQNIINECISHMNMNLGLPALTGTQQYSCAVQPTEHLKFLLDWPGLRVDNSPKAPKTKKEYEKKSKNWLNGRRAPNYGKTLFPFFIHDAERYLLASSKILIKNDEEKQKLYYDIVIYKVLAQLCGCSVSLHEQAKKAPFFCKNSVERKGRLKEILQSYASDHEYIQGFPSCFEEAIGYFDRKSNQYFHQFRSEYLGYDKNYDDDGDSYLEADDLPPRTRGRGMKRSPRDERDRYFNKRENRQNGRQRSGGADAEYWKKQFMNLKRELAKEHQMRIKAERERDNLKNLINTSAANNNMSADMVNGMVNGVGAATMSSHSGSSFGSQHGLPLTNDNSFDSMNGSSTTTASTTSSSVCGGNGSSNILGDINLSNNVLGGNMNNNNMMVNNNINTNMPMPQLQHTNSYTSAQSHSTHHTRSSQQQSSGMISNMQQIQMNMNNPSFQINHMSRMSNNGQLNNNNNAVSNPYGPAIPPIVHNSNNFNTDMNQLSSLKSNFMLQRNNNQIVNSTSLQQPIANMLPTMNGQQNNNNMNMNNMMNNNMMMNNTSKQPSLLFQNSANESNFGMPATDAFSTIIDTMPIMNRQQQISDDSYPGFGDNSHHALTSPAPHTMYSSFNNNNNNAVITNTTDPF